MHTHDVAVVGAGAAGLMAAIQAARAAPARKILALDGARHLGAKILVAGGGRCNVTHHAVDESAFAGSTPKGIRRILRRFDVADTVRFFSERGVELKREETGKLFPVTDSARTVLDALLGAARDAGVEVRHPWRVEAVSRTDDGFRLTADTGAVLDARRVILATGGRSLPKSGSDGAGYGLARALGHTLTPAIHPALVPLLLDEEHLTELSGLSFPARLVVRAATGRRLAEREGAVLCTHFGVSGPGVLDVSRYWIAARRDDPEATLHLDLLPGESPGELDRGLAALEARPVSRALRDRLPARLADSVLEAAEVPADRTGATLRREERRRLVTRLKEWPLTVTGDRGWRYAEVTAGGVPLSELRLETLESRLTPGLHLCGEICDVDGRIGGFNFQWAWASGYVAGTGAGSALPGNAD